MSLQVAFEEGVLNVPSLMSEFSIHMLGRKGNITSRPHTENMNVSSSVPTNRECEKLSMVPLPHWSWPSLEVWGRLPLSATKDSPHCWPQSVTNHTVVPLPG